MSDGGGRGAGSDRDVEQHPLVLRTHDLDGAVAALRTAGVPFRNNIESGPAGRQIQIEDPDGNPVELFEPAHRPH